MTLFPDLGLKNQTLICHTSVSLAIWQCPPPPTSGGVQWAGKPGNVRKFRCKERKSGDSEGIKEKKTRKVRTFCCVKFDVSQSEHTPKPPKHTVLDTRMNLIVVVKSQEKVSEFHPFWRLDTLTACILFYLYVFRDKKLSRAFLTSQGRSKSSWKKFTNPDKNAT